MTCVEPLFKGGESGVDTARRTIIGSGIKVAKRDARLPSSKETELRCTERRISRLEVFQRSRAQLSSE